MTDLKVAKNNGIDIQKVREDAQKEVNEEKVLAAKAKLKQKYREIDNARKILKNLETELEDLLREIAE